MKRGFLNNVKPKEKLVPAPAQPNGPAVGTATGTQSVEEISPMFQYIPYGKGILDNFEAPTTPFPPIHVHPSTPRAPPAGALGNLEIITIPFDNLPDANANSDAKPKSKSKSNKTNRTDPNKKRTQFLHYAITKRLLLTFPQFPKDIPGAFRPVKYEVKLCSGADAHMGYGVFATEHIAMGQVIFSERPLLVMPLGMWSNNWEVTGMKNEQWLKGVITQWEGVLEVAVNRMSDDERERFMALENSHKEDGSGEILGRVRTNGYSAEPLDGSGSEEEAGLPKGIIRYTCVGDVASRLNHSCISNTHRSFDVPSFSLSFTATRPILPGQQIFTSYCNPLDSYATRAAELDPYDVKCTCSACTDVTPDRDAFRETFEKEMKTLEAIKVMWTSESENGNNSPSKRKAASDDLKFLLRFQSQTIKEGLDTRPSYMLVLTALCRVYEYMGMRRESGQVFSYMERWVKNVEQGRLDLEARR